jgi:hypothetical protein
MHMLRCLKGLLADVAFHKHQLVRELICLAKQDDWNPQGEHIRESCFRAFAVPGNTKVHLEDAFNHLRDAERSSKNKVLNRWHSYFTVATSPITESEDMPIVGVSSDDWAADLDLNVWTGFSHC